MDAVILIAVILLATGIGMRLIHLLNAQHDARIAAHHFSDTLPGIGRWDRKHHGPTRGDSDPVDRPGATRGPGPF
ncbi:hypothetical protein [Streptomyces sp. G-G2]|uniref:hypothetical protein n=1 Tax=Streptomyces sp. G-G2 TaxID=3046201 RepID=UPI0024B9F83E|nr:hypothetical protein [Streptomyces sp. G-G2]MDJ0382339.1 hypothetical protein [Streptomyces sp. G-G2]